MSEQRKKIDINLVKSSLNKVFAEPKSGLTYFNEGKYLNSLAKKIKDRLEAKLLKLCENQKFYEKELNSTYIEQFINQQLHIAKSTFYKKHNLNIDDTEKGNKKSLNILKKHILKTCKFDLKKIDINLVKSTLNQVFAKKFGNKVSDVPYFSEGIYFDSLAEKTRDKLEAKLLKLYDQKKFHEEELDDQHIGKFISQHLRKAKNTFHLNTNEIDRDDNKSLNSLKNHILKTCRLDLKKEAQQLIKTNIKKLKIDKEDNEQAKTIEKKLDNLIFGKINLAEDEKESLRDKVIQIKNKINVLSTKLQAILKYSEQNKKSRNKLPNYLGNLETEIAIITNSNNTNSEKLKSLYEYILDLNSNLLTKIDELEIKLENSLSVDLSETDILITIPLLRYLSVHKSTENHCKLIPILPNDFFDRDYGPSAFENITNLIFGKAKAAELASELKKVVLRNLPKDCRKNADKAIEQFSELLFKKIKEQIFENVTETNRDAKILNLLKNNFLEKLQTRAAEVSTVSELYEFIRSSINEIAVKKEIVTTPIKKEITTETTEEYIKRKTAEIIENCNKAIEALMTFVKLLGVNRVVDATQQTNQSSQEQQAKSISESASSSKVQEPSQQKTIARQVVTDSEKTSGSKSKSSSNESQTVREPATIQSRFRANTAHTKNQNHKRSGSDGSACYAELKQKLEERRRSISISR